MDKKCCGHRLGLLIMDSAERMEEFRSCDYLCWPARLSQSTSWIFWSKQLPRELNCLLWWEKSIERSLCPSSTDKHRKVRGKTSYAQVKDFQCPFIPNFSSTFNLGSSVEQEEIEFGGPHWTSFKVKVVCTEGGYQSSLKLQSPSQQSSWSFPFWAVKRTKGA